MKHLKVRSYAAVHTIERRYVLSPQTSVAVREVVTRSRSAAYRLSEETRQKTDRKVGYVLPTAYPTRVEVR